MNESLLTGMRSADWLMRQSFPKLEYVVPGLIPEGLTFLVAAPKIGKSWLVLGLGIACASGGHAFGQLRVDQRPVLYLALEDGGRRLQDRMRSLGTSAPKSLHFITDIQPAVLLDTMREFMDLYEGSRPLVVIDTLGKVMPAARQNETQYGHDYGVSSGIKAVADDYPGSSVIVVHHTRKAESSDFLDAVSGTQGLAGAADSILVLRRDRTEAKAVLHVTSRDAAEGNYSLMLDGRGRWELDGATLAEAQNAARGSEATQGVGDRMAELIAEVNRHPEGINAAELVILLHEEASTVRRYLRRATDAGRISSSKRGLYTPVTSVTSVTLTADDPMNVTHETHVTLPIQECHKCGEPLDSSVITDGFDTHPACELVTI